jgi:hypothetical protein
MDRFSRNRADLPSYAGNAVSPSIARQKVVVYLFPEEVDALDALASASGDSIHTACGKAIKQRLRFIRR